MKPVSFFASEVAACVGMHPYQAVRDARLKVLKRYSADAYARFVAATQYTAPLSSRVDPAARTVATNAVRTGVSGEVAQASVETAIRSTILQKANIDVAALDLSDGDAVKAAVARAEPAVADAVSKDLAAVADTAAQQLRMAAGTVREPSARMELNKATKRSIATAVGVDEASIQDDHAALMRDGNDTFRRRSGPDGAQWSVGGRLDGISGDQKSITEIKTRASAKIFAQCLQGKVPQYDVVQTTVYMYVTGARDATLHNVQRNTQEVAAVPVPWSDELWGEVCRGLDEATREIQGWCVERVEPVEHA
jgi:hypothetical protein